MSRGARSPGTAQREHTASHPAEVPARAVAGHPAAGLRDALGNRGLLQLLRSGRAPGGVPLDPGTRRRMESGFGERFDDVRLHTGSRAAATTSALNARALTVGRDIVFGEGEFAPRSVHGQRLLAHELAHVVQQRATGAGGSGEVRAESDARAAAMAVASGGSATVRERAAPGTVQREIKEVGAEPGTGLLTTDKDHPIYWDIEADGVTVMKVGGDTEGPKPRAWEDTDTGILYVDPGTDVSPGDIYHGRWKDVRITHGRPFVAPAVPAPPKPPPPRPKAPKVAPKPPAPEQTSLEVPEVVITAKRAQPAPARPTAHEERGPAPAPLDAKELIGKHTSWANLDEDALGQVLLERAMAGDTATAQATLDELSTFDRDDVSYAFVRSATYSQLQSLAETAEGRKLLMRLYDELTSGSVADEEALQATWVMKALASRIDPAKLASAEQTAPVIPFSGIGLTNFSSASLSVERLPSGKLWVRSHMTQEHWQYAKRLPSAAFAAGLGREFDPDEIVGVNFIDEGKTVYVPALALLGLSNQETTKASWMMGEAFVTGLTLGFGGGAIATGEAATATVAGEAAGETIAVQGVTRFVTAQGLKRVMIGGAFAGGGINIVRQGAQLADETRTEFSVGEVLGSSLEGAFLAPVAVYVPGAGLVMTDMAVFSGAEQASKGHGWTAAVDFGSALAPYGLKRITAGPQRGPSFGQWLRPRAAAVGLRLGTAFGDLGPWTGTSYTTGLPSETAAVLVIDAAGRPIGTLAPGTVGLPSSLTLGPGLPAAPRSPGAWRTVEVGGAFQPYPQLALPGVRLVAPAEESPQITVGATTALSAMEHGKLLELEYLIDQGWATALQPHKQNRFTPALDETQSTFFRMVVGQPEFTSDGKPVATDFDYSDFGQIVERKAGDSTLDLSYQLRLQMYAALKFNLQYTIVTTRPLTPRLAQFLARWGGATRPP